MKRSPKLRPTLWDGLVVLLTLALAIGSAFIVWGGQEQAGELTVVISVDGQEVERCPLAELSDNDSVYSHNGYTLKVGMSYPIYPDKPCIRVVESDCPTQDCVHTGEIYRAGQSIVCLPARIIIALEGTPVSGDGPDLVIG
ncbi:MAG: NusG domain II-containing protein [Clostridium sp.]|nr:NusG domain II-containing protein [Clostridium sp.]